MYRLEETIRLILSGIIRAHSAKWVAVRQDGTDDASKNTATQDRTPFGSDTVEALSELCMAANFSFGGFLGLIEHTIDDKAVYDQ